jgi:hypothetical protein
MICLRLGAEHARKAECDWRASLEHELLWNCPR